MGYDAGTASRVRELLAGRADIVEKRMVGGLSFVAGGHMCCGVTGTALMVRVGAGDRAAVLARPHVRPMRLGGRELSGFVCVDPAGVRTDADLARWVQAGLDFVAGLPPRPAAG
jgi:hypothetical protein